MLRISDARMSGTSYGACILHVAPESFVGGPLAFVQTGDVIEVDVAQRRIHLHVSDEELARRRAAWVGPAPRYERGYGACSRSISARPTTAAISISWSTGRACPSPRFTDQVRPRCNCKLGLSHCCRPRVIGCSGAPHSVHIAPQQRRLRKTCPAKSGSHELMARS